MAGYPTSCLDGQNSFGWDTFAPADPIGHCRLPDTKLLGEPHLPASGLDGLPDYVNIALHLPVYTTTGCNDATAPSGNWPVQTMPVPKAAPSSPLWQRFVDCVQDLRRPKTLNQTALGRSLGVGQQMVSEIKRGTKNPSYDVYVAMASYAEMSVEYLLTGRGPPRPWSEVDESFHRILQIWEALDDAHRAKLRELAEELYDLQGRRKRRPRHADTDYELTGTHKLPKDSSN